MTRIKHVALSTDDPVKTAEFYREETKTTSRVDKED